MIRGSHGTPRTLAASRRSKFLRTKSGFPILFSGTGKGMKTQNCKKSTYLKIRKIVYFQGSFWRAVTYLTFGWQACHKKIFFQRSAPDMFEKGFVFLGKAFLKVFLENNLCRNVQEFGFWKSTYWGGQWPQSFLIIPHLHVETGALHPSSAETCVQTFCRLADQPTSQATVK